MDWVVFLGLGMLIGAHALYLMILPSADPHHWRAYTDDPVMLAYLADDFRSSGATAAWPCHHDWGDRGALVPGR